MRYCYGVRKRGPKLGCLVKKLVGGGSIEATDIGLNGRPLNEYLVGHIKEKAEEMKKKAAANEVNAAVQTEKQPLKNVIDSDECESDHMELMLDVCC